MAGGTRHDYSKTAKDNDIMIATQLGYPEIVIQKLQAEDDPNKRTRILRNARQGLYGRY